MPPAPDASTKVQWRLGWDGSMVICLGQSGQAIMSHHEQTYLIFPQHPYIAHSRGWTAEDMEQNVVMVHQSDELQEGARMLVTRAVELARTLLRDAPESYDHLTRGGRKAHHLEMEADKPASIGQRVG